MPTVQRKSKTFMDGWREFWNEMPSADWFGFLAGWAATVAVIVVTIVIFVSSLQWTIRWMLR